MKKLLAFLVTVSLCHCATRSTYALYDPRTLPNNKVGVHILNPDELDSAAKLVNSQGGDWGYVTLPIQPTERDLVKWNTFMQKCHELHLIPLIRITTIPQGGTWSRGHDTDLVDFANFLNELDWPITNRYIILFNEVNRSAEWGGNVEPAKYAEIVKNARTIFKERSADFFLLGPALDNALPNSSSSLNATSYLQAMAIHDPLIWSYFDGWASHSYPNPGFTSSPHKAGLQSILGYKSELNQLKLAPKPIFITETGWDQDKLNPTLLSSYWQKAWELWNADPNVVAVTPFVLHGGEQFKSFTLLGSDGNYRPSGQAIFDLSKSPGSPNLASVKSTPTPKPIIDLDNNSPFFKTGRALFKLENIFRVVLGLPVKANIALKDIPLTVELAQNSPQWERGLSHRQTLGELDGMLFIFPHLHVPVFWMKDMQFPIDMIWLKDNLVIDITPNTPVETSLQLPTYSPRELVNQVLETRGGWAEENNIVVGDQLIIN
ncbi:MAG: DUF192 domain-containing protein [bacterium]